MRILTNSTLTLSKKLIIVLITFLTITACDDELFQKPEAGGTNVDTFESVSSKVGAKFSIPLADLEFLVNSKVPNSFRQSGNGKDACGRILGQKVCAGTKYKYSVNRSGDISLTQGGNNTLVSTLDMSIDGKGGFRGDGAKLLKLDWKNFDAKIRIKASFTPSISDKWCPQLDVNLSYNWLKKPRVEIVDGVYINVQDQVESKIDSELPGLISGAKSAINCEEFKKQLASVYGKTSFPLDFDNEKLFVNFNPQAFGFSGVNVSAKDLSAAALLSVEVEVSSTSIKSELLPLPPLQNIPNEAPIMILSLPFKPSYELITNVLSTELKGKSYTKDSEMGTVEVRVRGVEVYPSNGKVVVGLNIEADLPSSYFDVKGDVFLIAIPVVEGNSIRLEQVEFAQRVDNDFWNATALVFEGLIKEKIAEAGVIDLSEQVELAKTKLDALLQGNESPLDVNIKLSDVNLGLGRVEVGAEHLAVEGVFSATTEVTPK